MKVRRMREFLDELVKDYGDKVDNFDMVISQYFAFVFENGGDEDPEYFCVVDDPIEGIVINEENEEVRFAVDRSDEQAIQEVEKKEYWRVLKENG